MNRAATLAALALAGIDPSSLSSPFNGYADRIMRADSLVMPISGRRVTHEDAKFFERELEFLSTRVHEKQFLDLTADKAFPMAPDQPSVGQTSYAWPEVEHVATGSAGTGYDDKGGRGDFKRSKTATPTRVYTSHYGFSIADLEKARLLGQPLSQLKATSAKRIIDQDVNSDVWNGNSKLGIPGLLTTTGVTKTQVAQGAASSRLWSVKEPDEILKDCLSELTAFTTATKGVLSLQPNRLALPVTRYQDIASRRLNGTSDMTVLEWIEKRLGAATGQSDFAVTKHPELEYGVSSSAWFMWYRFDEMAGGRIQMLPFQELPPQELGWEQIIHCRAEGGGLVIFQPICFRIGYGI